MRRLALLPVCFALMGCTPTIVGSNPNTVLIGNTDWSNAREAFAMAEGECQKYGKHARLTVSDPWNYQQSYNCEP